MNKVLIVYCRRNVGLYSLIYLWGRFQAWTIKVVSDEWSVLWFADKWGLEVIELEDALYRAYDIFICIHGRAIIPKEAIGERLMINLHPTHYNGHNPVMKYIQNKDTNGSIRCMHISEKVDEGELIHEETFPTGICHEYADYYNIAAPIYIKTIEEALQKLGL